MMKSTDNVPLVEDGCDTPNPVRLTIWHKVLFYLVGLTAALTICLLIRLSNKLAADAQRRAMMHFKEISNRIGHRFDN
ncbi:uncharacterized protein LOC115757946 [Drosophila novamexicana]|uniref:Uncharacterized protein n=1 Tax=Drosophila virilis TaxID=7244 RepID=B4LK35_DROVI|nr:uncharacterized protein LOC6627137 [Drosophila virilis]XP_030554277.1 uncharacterized protein LOC115757946 [Drosophila novamexicana]EDW60624.1 uncharacterized protein Dvir_GJ21577 [Drosophila virilis]